jgi:hypothetical protein
MTNRDLDPQAADRLIKLLGMLGSAHDGERAAAALKADAFVRSHGLQWRDVIAMPAAVPPPRPPRWRTMAHTCWDRSHHLNDREREFVQAMMFWSGTPSEKQLAWLNRIYEKVTP